MKKTIAILMICVSLIACGGISTSDLADKVKVDITEQFIKEASKTGARFTISSFGLVHKSGSEYSGILQTIENGEDYTYQVDVSYDGSTYMWKIVN